MPKLILGVNDIPYSGEPHKGKRSSKGDNSKTTGEVAEILEGKYHVMAMFYQKRAPDIASLMERKVSDALEKVLDGRKPGKINYGSVDQKIDQMFRAFLTNNEIASMGLSGLPMQAAMAGKSSRFKSGKGPVTRPMFVDTGLYRKSFKSEIK